MIKRYCSVLITLFLFPLTVFAGTFTSEKHGYELELVAKGFEHPWSLEFLPNGDMLVTERPGRLRIVRDGKLLDKEVTGLPSIRVKGQGGLLDIALAPNFEESQMIYISYSGPDKRKFGTEVARARLVNDSLQDLEIIFRLQPKTTTGYHFGSRLIFGKDGKLYISLGDRGDQDKSQDTSNHIGSLIRLNPDGSVPEDNPFINNENVMPEIYTYGNRNMQGIEMHPETGQIWTVEHGPQGGDELNLMNPGVNYGWPEITYGKNYVIGTTIGEGTDRPDVQHPVHYWIPSIATSSLLYYDGDAFPAWKGNFFVGSLVFGELARLEMKDNKVVHEERLVNGAVDRIREVKQGPDGYLYILTDDPDGELLRIKPAN